MKRVTQREVAARAQVSRATVSYVLNDTAKSRVPISGETRRRVIEAAEALGYEPDVSARTLRSGKTREVGVLVPDMGNPHYWQLLTGIEREAHRHDYTLLIFHSALVESEEEVGLRELAGRRIDGLVLISSFPPSWPTTIKRLTSQHSPIVDLSNVESPFDRVVSDYRAGAKELMNHLIGHGHRRIGFIYGVASELVGLDRLEPYEEALRAWKLPAQPGLVIRCGTTVIEGYNAAKSLLARSDRPTAVIAVNDLQAIAVLRAAADLGLSVPDDVSVAGFDDVPFSRLLTPSLTSVHRDTEWVGRTAFRLLLERMADPLLPRRTERADSQLVVRESTGAAP